MHYERLGEPMFRQTSIPRRLSLDSAKEEGAALVPDELRQYAARSRGGRASRADAAAPGGTARE
jgi:hypothetical protein